jgi:hypothetical protein
MKVAIVIFVIGDRYIKNFNDKFKTSVESYCVKYDYDLIILDSLIRNEEYMDTKKFYWQRLLIPNKYKDYDFVVSLDSDIFINSNAPPLPLNEIPEGKVSAINERKYLGTYEPREIIQVRMGWEKTGKDWYALSGENKQYNDHINGGLVIYQPKHHGETFEQLYNNNISNYMKYHQDDQSILSSYLIDNNLIYWLDERFNRIWFFWREIFHPNFYSLSDDGRKRLVHSFIEQNYFVHFTSGYDIKYI